MLKKFLMVRQRVSAIAVFLLVISGCASKQPNLYLNNDCKALTQIASSDTNKYSLYIDSVGHLINTEKIQIDKPGHDGTEQYLNNIFDNYRRLYQVNPKIQMTVFIHGGLNTSEAVKDRLDNLIKPMLQACKYPLFISWRSGAPGNYSDHLFNLRRGEYLSTQNVEAFIESYPASPFVVAEDLLRSIARIPAATYRMLIKDNISLEHLFTDTQADTDFRGKTASYASDIHYHADASDKGLSFNDVKTIVNPMKLVSAPFIDAMGTGAWNSMLRRTDLVLTKNEQFNGGQHKPTAVTRFFEKWQNDTNIENKNILLIGHSMGTIIANKIIAEFPQAQFSPIVYMAAACSLSDLEQVISPYLSHDKSREFYSLSLSPTRDDFENFAESDIAPRGSLLVWIDKFLNRVNSFGDRTAGYWPNIIKVTARVFPEKIRKQVHLTKFGVNDGTPQNHGDFDNYPFWDKSFWINSLRDANF